MRGYSLWRRLHRKSTRTRTRMPQPLEVWARGWHSYTLTRWSVGHVSRQPNHRDINRTLLLVWDWTKSSLFVYKGIIGAYCFINIQNLESSSNLWDCKIGLITVLCQLINCSTPNTASYNCEVLFKSVFFTNFFHKIVRRSVKLRREILNLDSKIKHLRPVYKKRYWKAAQKTAKLVCSHCYLM